MEIKSIDIQNYRAIRKLRVPLNYSINPIIGINESGKTSILKAILCLDKGRDRHNKGDHLEYQNKYSTRDTTNCQIVANLRLDTQDLFNLKISSKVNTGSSKFLEISSIDTKTEIKYARRLSEDKGFTILNDEFEEETKKKLSKYIQNHFPVILYFDDFTDRVPEEVNFADSYPNDGKLGRGAQREWQQIIEEILRRSELEGIDDHEKALQNYLRVEDYDRRQDILSDIQDVLNQEIIEEWKKIKQRGKINFADDSENLLLELANVEGSKFQFKVRDTSNQSKRRTFNVNERSKGFQWFFNYMIKLKFNPRYTLTQENSIFLLDEPGSYLHSSAQTELLKELKTVSEKNKIIYCTHSQFLLNPDDIKLGSIKIANKVDSDISLQLFGEYDGNRSSGALSPIYQALQISNASDFTGNVIITEGIIDYYLLKMTQDHWNFPRKDTKIIPGSGAGNSTTLISFALGFSSKFKVIFDNDRGGLNAIRKYKKEFGDSIERNFHVYHQKTKGFKLEKHFKTKDEKRLLEITKTDSLKKAIPLLYLDHKDQVEETLDKLTEDTKELIGITINDIGI